MKSLLLSTLVVVLPLGAFAQESADEPTSPRRRVVLPAANPSVPSTARSAPADRSLSRNVTVSLRGMLQGAIPVDLELTGCGPEFVTDYLLPQEADSDLPPSALTVQVNVTESGDGFHAGFSLGVRIAVATSTQGGPGGVRNIEFRETRLRGTALVKAGAPVVVSKIAGQPLELTVSEAK